jgi:hypothetical protein
MRRRTPYQMQSDRDALKVRIGYDWQRVPEDARPSDIDALVKAGVIESKIEQEWDKQGGHGANLFGGAGVVMRRRRYVRRPSKEA